eukprot:TRINITY_DN13781_c0_g1_i3.p1 TRINITY_DN13781_c0_g1~~TRINITY_DN13781_c0_g1_i3.p1  ORF type:complete len:365 (-),score=68.50 TRINITY_DN13781_c0_g1_i3:60-1154(-)
MESKSKPGTCKRDDHFSKLVGFCGTKTCKEPRMFCAECLICGYHNNHIRVIIEKFVQDPSILSAVFFSEGSDRDFKPLNPLKKDQQNNAERIIEDAFDQMMIFVEERLNQKKTEYMQLLKDSSEQRTILSTIIENYVNLEELLDCFNCDKENNYTTFVEIFSSLLADIPIDGKARDALKNLYAIEGGLKKVLDTSFVGNSLERIFSVIDETFTWKPKEEERKADGKEEVKAQEIPEMKKEVQKPSTDKKEPPSRSRVEKSEPIKKPKDEVQVSQNKSEEVQNAKEREEVLKEDKAKKEKEQKKPEENISLAAENLDKLGELMKSLSKLSSMLNGKPFDFSYESTIREASKATPQTIYDLSLIHI